MRDQPPTVGGGEPLVAEAFLSPDFRETSGESLHPLRPGPGLMQQWTPQSDPGELRGLSECGEPTEETSADNGAKAGEEGTRALDAGFETGGETGAHTGAITFHFGKGWPLFDLHPPPETSNSSPTSSSIGSSSPSGSIGSSSPSSSSLSSTEPLPAAQIYEALFISSWFPDEEWPRGPLLTWLQDKYGDRIRIAPSEGDTFQIENASDLLELGPGGPSSTGEADATDPDDWFIL